MQQTGDLGADIGHTRMNEVLGVPFGLAPSLSQVKDDTIRQLLNLWSPEPSNLSVSQKRESRGIRHP